MRRETPTISTVHYGSAAASMDMLAQMDACDRHDFGAGHAAAAAALPKLMMMRQVGAPTTSNQETAKMAAPNRRLVKIIIIDPDENVPLDKCLLYSSAEKLTDATDQELFFEVDIKVLLDAHNDYRVTLRNKAVKERDEKLEPARIRDLRMVVVNIASF